MKNLITIRKVVKGEKPFYNIYLFGFQVQAKFPNERSGLYFSAREYLRANDIEIEEVVIEDESSSKKK